MSAAIDITVFKELQAAAGADFVVELVKTFAEEVPGMLSALRSARSTNDADAWRRAAHSLKANSLTFGATALAAQARALELNGLQADAAADAAAVDALSASYDEAAAALNELAHA